ncbi:MAG: helix-hairpin-helix domain-containing protein [Anaerolineae bacterium]
MATPETGRPTRSDGVFLLVTVALIVVVAGAAAVVVLTRPAPVEIVIVPPQPTSTPAPTSTRLPITVYVTGAVNRPNQLVTLPHGSRVQEAITAAGGLTDEAVLSAVNLAGILRDGDQVHVPSAVERVSLPTALPSSQTVAINRATEEELTALPGIGPVLAAQIIAYREANGPFADLTALGEVAGIGERTLEMLAPLVVFD